jgi:Ca2+/H+ antiporter, TMEM165/GDT1 family
MGNQYNSSTNRINHLRYHLYRFWVGDADTKGKGDEQKKFYNNAFVSGFLLILFAEWVDKTQIASALFATKYNAVMILCGTIIALTLVSIIAVYFGKFIADRINKKVITRIAVVLFIIMGVVFFF